MTAEEARELSKNTVENEKLKVILQKIQDRATKGKTEYQTPKMLSVDQEEYFIKLGYTVEGYESGNYSIIKW